MKPSESHRPQTRRAFLRTSTVGVAALAQAPLLWGQADRFKGANERVRVAVIGIHGMGQNHIAEYAKLPNVEVAALCDVDQNLFAEVIQKRLKDKPAPKTYTDLRRLYEDRSIDAVSVVTPNHWHALAAIWAIQAGKHVSVEKPCCHNFFEGRMLVEAAAKYPKIVVQDGAEQRSNPCAQSMAQFLHEGGLGEVYMAKGICYKRRPEPQVIIHPRRHRRHRGARFSPRRGMRHESPRSWPSAAHRERRTGSPTSCYDAGINGP